MQTYTGKMPRPRLSPQRRHTFFVRACASETHVKISLEPLDTEIYRKNDAAQNEPGTQTHILCEPAQAKLIKISQEPPYTEIYRKNAAAQTGPRTQTHFVRACASETPVKISQEPPYTEIYRKNAAAQSEHPDQAPAFTPTVRTPQCGHTVWGKMLFGHVRSSPPFLNATKYMLT